MPIEEWRWLLENDVADEISFFIVPVVLGQGARAVSDASRALVLDPID